MAKYIDAEELKKHIRWRFMNAWNKSKIGLTECEEIDSVIDEEKEIKVFDRDTGAEPILEEKTGCCHVHYADGHGEFQTNTSLDWKCPNCGWFVGELYSGFGKWHIQGESSFCAKCGQRIDWTKPREEEKRRYEEEKERKRLDFEKKHGISLDNMNERKRIKYGVMERSKDER